MRHWRADTSFEECCSTCGEALLPLRWGHEDRCARFQRARRRAVRVGALLLVLALALATPAYAQLEAINPEKLAAGLSTSLPVALAWGCVVLLLMLCGSNVFWVRAYISQTEKRFEALTEYQSQTLTTLTSVVTLGNAQHDGLKIMSAAMDHVANRRDGG